MSPEFWVLVNLKVDVDLVAMRGNTHSFSFRYTSWKTRSPNSDYNFIPGTSILTSFGCSTFPVPSQVPHLSLIYFPLNQNIQQMARKIHLRSKTQTTRCSHHKRSLHLRLRASSITSRANLKKRSPKVTINNSYYRLGARLCSWSTTTVAIGLKIHSHALFDSETCFFQRDIQGHIILLQENI